MRCDFIFYSEHAVQQMAARKISTDAVEEVIQFGEVIKYYPDEEPAPCWLMLGLPDGKPLHVVFSRDIVTDFCIVITAYHPDPTVWQQDFKTKK